MEHGILKQDNFIAADEPPLTEENVLWMDLLDKIIRIPLITDIIFDYLPLPDVLSCSLTSKLLLSTAREHIGRRRTVLLKCKSDTSELQRCAEFLKDETYFKFPFRGICFVITGTGSESYSKTPQCSSTDESTCDETKNENLLATIFGLISMKHVVVISDCSANFFEIILGFFLHVLKGDETETVTVRKDSQIFWIGWLHPGYKHLKRIVTDATTGSTFSETFIDQLLTNCPALEELQLPIDVRFVDPFASHGKLSLIKWLRISYFEPESYVLARKLAKSGTKLELVIMDTCQATSPMHPNWSLDELSEVMQILLPCLNNVTKVLVRYVSFDQLAETDFPVMPWAKEVQVCCYYDPFGEEREKLVSVQEHLTTYFPNARICEYEPPPFKHDCERN